MRQRGGKFPIGFERKSQSTIFSIYHFVFRLLFLRYSLATLLHCVTASSKLFARAQPSNPSDLISTILSSSFISTPTEFPMLCAVKPSLQSGGNLTCLRIEVEDRKEEFA